MVGEGAAVLVRRVLGAAGLDPETPGALDRFLALYDERLLDTTRLYPGIRDALDAARSAAGAGRAHQQATPAGRAAARRRCGVRAPFIEVVGGDGPLPRKPDPAGLPSLRLHAGGGPMVLVGDSPVDAETAGAARVPFVLAGYGFGASAFDRRRRRRFVAASRPPTCRAVDSRGARAAAAVAHGLSVARQAAAGVSTSSFDAARVPMVTIASSRPRRRTASAASSRDSTSTASPGFNPWRSTKRRNAAS